MSNTTTQLCNENNSLLVVVDIQSRLTPTMEPDGLATVIRNSDRLLQTAKEMGIPVIVTEQYPKGLGHTVDELSGQLAPATPLVDKTCFACSGSEAFLKLVRSSGRKQIVLVGMETHVCVLQTAMQLTDMGYQIFICEDSVCSRDADHKQNALQRMRNAGVIISNHESVMFEWLRDAKHPQFKAVSALLK